MEYTVKPPPKNIHDLESLSVPEDFTCTFELCLRGNVLKASILLQETNQLPSLHYITCTAKHKADNKALLNKNTKMSVTFNHISTSHESQKLTIPGI